MKAHYFSIIMLFIISLLSLPSCKKNKPTGPTEEQILQEWISLVDQATKEIEQIQTPDDAKKQAVALQNIADRMESLEKKAFTRQPTTPEESKDLMNRYHDQLIDVMQAYDKALRDIAEEPLLAREIQVPVESFNKTQTKIIRFGKEKNAAKSD